MNKKQKINRFRRGLLATVFLLLLGLTVNFAPGLSPTAHATKADDAAKYCKKYKDDKVRQACVFGYVQGAKYCKDLNKNLPEAVRKACNDGVSQAKDDGDGGSGDDADAGGSGLSNDTGDCGQAETAFIKCDAKNSGDVSDNGVWALLLIIINVMTAGVGVLAIGGIVYAAILYTTAEDKADQLKKAREIITNVVIGIVAFALMWAALNFIIPGGVFA